MGEKKTKTNNRIDGPNPRSDIKLRARKIKRNWRVFEGAVISVHVFGIAEPLSAHVRMCTISAWLKGF